MNENMNDDKGGNLRGWLRLYANEAAVAVICVLYLASAALKLVDTGRSLPVIITGAAMSFLLGTAINNLFRNQGILLGDRDPEVMASVARHEKLAEEAAPFIDELSDFCERETARALRRERVRILAEESLRLEDAFDEQGSPLPYQPRRVSWRPFRRGWLGAIRFNRMESRRAAACLRAATLRITPLSAGELISEGHRRGDPFYMGRSKRAFYGQEMRSGMLSKAAIAIIFGYWGVELIETFSPAMLLWRFLQIGMLLASGVMTMYGATGYMKNEYRARMTSKSAYLVQFKERKRVHEDEPEREEDQGN